MSICLIVMVLLVDQFLLWAVGGFLLFIFHCAGCCGWVVVILFLFGRFWVPISAWRLTILIEIYCSFPQYLKLGHSHFLNTCFPIHYSVIIQSYDTVYIVWATEDVGKQMMNKMKIVVCVTKSKKQVIDWKLLGWEYWNVCNVR
jgi:hypothetical protein